MPRRPDMPCAGCGNLMWRGKGSLPDGQATCRECRRIAPRPYKRVARSAECLWCGKVFDLKRSRAQKFCSPSCFARHDGKRRQVRSDDDKMVMRSRREWAAPGLTYAQRRALLRTWRKQRTPCAYCGQRLADTVDHVVPLVRGGTNWEGNLVPACKSCNSSKSGWMVIEWRTGIRAPAMTTDLPWRRTQKRRSAAITGQQKQLSICPECGALCLNTYCNSTCNTRYVARRNYRLKAGIPLDAPLYGRSVAA